MPCDYMYIGASINLSASVQTSPRVVRSPFTRPSTAHGGAAAHPCTQPARVPKFLSQPGRFGRFAWEFDRYRLSRVAADVRPLRHTPASRGHTLHVRVHRGTRAHERTDRGHAHSGSDTHNGTCVQHACTEIRSLGVLSFAPRMRVDALRPRAQRALPVHVPWRRPGRRVHVPGRRAFAPLASMAPCRRRGRR